jgi:hypothetical protein
MRRGCAAPLEYNTATEYGKVAAQNTGFTPELKNYYADRQPGESLAAYQARAEGMKSWAQATGEQKNAAASGMTSPLDFTTAQHFGQTAAQNALLTPDQKNAAASGLTTPLDFSTAQHFGQTAAQNAALTPEQKNLGMTGAGGSMNAIAAGAEAKGVGEALAAQQKAITEKGLAAGKTLTTLQRMSQLSDHALEGEAAPAVQAARSFLTTFGIPSETVSKGQEFVALSNKLVMDALNGSLGVGVSNADVKFISNINPALAHTIPARREIIETLTALAKRDQEVAKMSGEYRRAHGSLDGFDTVLAQYGETHPLFEGRKNVSAGAAQSPGAIQDGATATNKQTGQKIIFKNGQWAPVI